jgi:uncharacterized protein (DUF3084 family)
MDGTLVLLSVWAASGAGLAAWRWWLAEQTRQFGLDLEARASREAVKNAHELAMRAQRLELDTKELDELRAQLKATQRDVQTLQLGGMKR